jgi:hypothetical protein
MIAMADTSESWPMSLVDARRILEGKGSGFSTKAASDIFLKEIVRLNGIINTQARMISDARKALT